MKKARRIISISVLSLIGLLVVLLAALAIDNLRMPQSSPVVEVLSDADKLRLAETVHLRRQLGDSVWPGWGDAGIPMIVYNEEYAFLVGYPDPPDGWIRVPAGTQHGGPWELVPADTFDGQPYYRQRLRDPNTTPQAFVVQVGERWVSSLGTYEWMRISLGQTIRQDLPPVLRPVFPYRLFIGQLVNGNDQYISLTAHELFHAYQGMASPGRLAGAESASRQYERQYPWDDASLQADWRTELDLLVVALRQTEPDQVVEPVRSFLAARANRRQTAQLAAELITYERQREWLEGLGRYAELEIWRQAAGGSYTPIPETTNLADFEQYRTFADRWSRELGQITRMADDEGDGRFYYSGMAQAYLLDRLLPDWKQRAFDDDVWLEDLLELAVQQ